ncbi:MAG: translation initiation factor IF-2 [Phycisphaerae bacterium]
MATRVHLLSKELGVTSKAVLDKCRAEGLDVKNHMTVLSAGLEATIREWFSEGEHQTTEETTERVNLEKIRSKGRRRKKEVPVAEGSDQAQEQAAVGTEQEIEDVAEEIEAKSSEPSIVEEPHVQPVSHPVKSVERDVLIPAARVELPHTKPVSVKPVEVIEEPPAEPVRPVGPMNVPKPAVMRGPRVVRVEKADIIPKPVPRDFGPRAIEPDVAIPLVPGRPGKKGKVPPVAETEEEAAKNKKVKSRVNPRRGGVVESIEQLKEWRDRDLLERSQRLAQASDHPSTVRRAEPKKQKAAVAAAAPAVRQSKVQITEPILVKEFCSAVGVPFSKLFPKLMAQGMSVTINQAITTEQAELLALDLGIEIEVLHRKSHYEELVDQFTKREKENQQRRGPIVTFLGHVDHGKTSLLDRIRNTRVAAGEAGGITQHIGAYRVPIHDRFVVFLDTPGHEAFTALRARGAQMTDIVVLVVAANDGVMPQTVEAISHAKAANVPIVVALNKIDLPNVDQHKVLGQLAEHNLIPTEWGGDVDVIRTSATTGEGMDQLVEHLNTLADLLDLKANPTGPATGVVIEARQDPNRGTVADLMIHEGTLSLSDIIVVGAACGRVRAMFDDTGKPIEKAGPASPVEILGLDQVPEAGDKFFVADSLARAQEMADEKRQEDRSEYLQAKPKVTLETILQQVEAGQVQHLNLIVKTDTQGSLDVLRNKLTELGTTEVKVRILHIAVGGITEGDAILAEASNAIILGFGVVADDLARSKAKTLDVEIRTYTVIYHLLEDITSALEGLLSPTYEQKILGRAAVREVFKVTRVGSVAGCLVTEGLIERSAKVRIIRQNVIVREDASLESLKRFKDDARDVRQGFECGIKIANFDDVKEGDIIEAYQMIEVSRKLQPAGSGG